MRRSWRGRASRGEDSCPPLHQPWRGNQALSVAMATRGLRAGTGGKRNLHDPDLRVKAGPAPRLTRMPVGNDMPRLNRIKADK